MVHEPHSPPFENQICEQIRRHAMSFPETTEGSSCVNRAFAAGGKNFLFLGEKADLVTLRLKLLEDGWTKLEFDPKDAPPLARIEEMTTESFGLLAPARVRKLL